MSTVEKSAAPACRSRQCPGSRPAPPARPSRPETRPNARNRAGAMLTLPFKIPDSRTRAEKSGYPLNRRRVLLPRGRTGRSSYQTPLRCTRLAGLAPCRPVAIARQPSPISRSIGGGFEAPADPVRVQPAHRQRPCRSASYGPEAGSWRRPGLNVPWCRQSSPATCHRQ